MNKTIIRLLVICLVITMTAPVILATDSNTIQPRYTYANTLDAVLDISNGVAFCAVSLQLNDFNNCSVFCRLQQQQDGSWVTLKSWSEEAVYYVYSSQRWAVASGHNYRLSVYGYVYGDNGDIIETITNSDYCSYP